MQEDFSNVIQNPEMLQEFLNLMDSQISKHEELIAQIEENKKQKQMQLDDFKRKKEILTNYLGFIENNGYGNLKQQNDDFIKKRKESDSERIIEENPHNREVCRRKYFDARYSIYISCMQNEGHSGPCGGL